MCQLCSLWQPNTRKKDAWDGSDGSGQVRGVQLWSAFFNPLWPKLLEKSQASKASWSVVSRFCCFRRRIERHIPALAHGLRAMLESLEIDPNLPVSRSDIPYLIQLLREKHHVQILAPVTGQAFAELYGLTREGSEPDDGCD